MSVEFTFYLLLPPLIWFIRTKIRNVASFLIITAILWQLIGGYLRAKYGFDSKYDWSSRLFLLTALPSFSFGIYHYFQEQGMHSSFIEIIYRFGLSLVLIDLITRILQCTSEYRYPYIIEFQSIMHGALGYLAYGSLGLLALRIKSTWYPVRNFPKRISLIVSFLGKISFSIYLYHLPCLVLAHSVTPTVLGIFISWFSTLILSYLSFLLVEKPFHDYGIRRFHLI